jgi:hypothetical protein
MTASCQISTNSAFIIFLSHSVVYIPAYETALLNIVFTHIMLLLTVSGKELYFPPPPPYFFPLFVMMNCSTFITDHTSLISSLPHPTPQTEGKEVTLISSINNFTYFWKISHYTVLICIEVRVSA